MVIQIRESFVCQSTSPFSISSTDVNAFPSDGIAVSVSKALTPSSLSSSERVSKASSGTVQPKGNAGSTPAKPLSCSSKTIPSVLRMVDPQSFHSKTNWDRLYIQRLWILLGDMQKE